MADKKIGDLTAIATQSLTDLFEVSLNGLGSRKETRAQLKAYFAANIFNAANTVWVDGNGNNANNGSENSPYADQLAANTALTGTIANQKLIKYNSGTYSTSGFTLKPNVSVQGSKNSLWTDSKAINLDASWSSAPVGSINYLLGCNLNTTDLTVDYSALSVGGLLSLWIEDSYLHDITFVSTTGHTPKIQVNDSKCHSATFSSVNVTANNLEISSTLTIQSSGGGGTTTANLTNCPLSATTITMTASVGSVTNVTMTGNQPPASLTVDSTRVNLTIDASSVPQAGINYTGGATSAQVTLTTPAGAVYASSSRTNYTPTSSTVEGNLAGIDTALGAIVPAQNVNPNVIIGGNFDTNPWQRGVTFTGVSSGTYTADRWRWSQSGSGVVNVTKTANAPSAAQAGFVVNNCMRTKVTTADTSIAAGDVYRQTYFVEGPDWAEIAGASSTLSFWVYATVTGTYCASVMNSANTRCFIAEFTVNAANTWEKKTITIPDSSGTGSWVYTPGGIGLQINFALACGSTFQGSTGWQTTAAGVYATSNQVNAMHDVNNVFDIALIKLEPGSTATAYPIENQKDVISKCERYYETSVSCEAGFYFPTTDQTGAVNVQMPASGTNGVSWYVPFRSRKAVTPTVTVCDNNGTTGAVYKGVAGAAANIVSIGNNGFAAGTSNATNSNALYFHYKADSELL